MLLHVAYIIIVFAEHDHAVHAVIFPIVFIPNQPLKHELVQTFNQFSSIVILDNQYVH